MKLKKVSLVTRFAWAGISTSVLNTALFWERRGYYVEIIAVGADMQRFPFTDFYGKQIKVIDARVGGRFPLAEIRFASRFRKMLHESEWVIAFDVGALLLAGCACTPRYDNLIYHSLEFFEPNPKSTVGRVKKAFERYFSRRAKCLFVQDRYRADYLRNDLGVTNMRYVYNSPCGAAITEGNDYFRKKYTIPDDRKIVLCIGSLIKEHYLLEMLDSLPSWDETFVLVLHGWFPDSSVRVEAERLAEAYPGRLHISTALFDNEDKFVPYQSCDIVFVGFSSQSNNTRYAAGSAGKIFDAMKVGKPIYGYDTPGMKDLLEGNGLGFVFSDPADINRILLKIVSDYSALCAASRAAYNKYEFNTQYEKVITNLG